MNDVEIERHDRGALQDGGDAPHDDQLDLPGGKVLQGLAIACVQDPPRPAFKQARRASISWA